MKLTCIHGALTVLLFEAAALCQADRSAITGTLRDPSGAVVSRARISVKYSATGFTRSVESNDAGAYYMSGLPLGATAVEVEAKGFRVIRSEVELKVGETRTIDFTLELAAVDATVEVVAQADLARNSAEYGAVMQNQQIADLPINGRNWQNLMTLVPGAVDTGAGNVASVRFFARGGDDNNFRIDGVDATTVRNQADTKSRLMISEDAIAEFRVNSALYTAESGAPLAARLTL
jgi:hypothetical protein